MSDVKTFTISGNNEEIQDMIGKGASPIDDPVVDKETRDELEGDDSDTEGQSRSPDDDLQNIIDKNPEDITATETRNLKIFESEGNEEAGDKLKEIESDHESVSSDDPEDRVDMEQLIKEFPLNVWHLIDTYFRDNSYYKSKHQLDSYNQLLYSETNGIRYIIRRENPLSIYKGLDKDNSFDHKIYIYFGETLDEMGNIKKEGENIFLSSPSIYDDDKSSYMYPNDARLRSLTYAMNIFCNIGVYIEDLKTKKKHIKNFEKVNIGVMPIMVHSKPCVLHNLESQKLTELGECPYDQGGYFIINGKEKVIISQEKKVNNVLYITKPSDVNIVIQGLITSVSKEGFQSSRTTAIEYLRTNINNTGPPKYLKADYVHRFVVRILGLDVKIPLFILFRALGIQSDREIINMIVYDNDVSTLKNKLMESLYNTIKDSQPFYDEASAYKFISVNTKGKQVFNVINIINNNFIPNYGDDNLEKAKYLALSIRKILLTHIGILNLTDRDSYSNKRIDVSGSLLRELYRELWGKFNKSIRLKIDSEYNYVTNKIITIDQIIRNDNLKNVFNNNDMNEITRSFGSTFGTGISAKQGIVQDLNRVSMLGTLSHIRRLRFPLPSGSKAVGPRKLHNSQWGFVCPSESPDGANTGIINHLSIIASISFDVVEDGIIEALLDNDVILLKDTITTDIYNSTKIYLNGKWIGIHNNPKVLVRILKLLKLNSFININTSISWKPSIQEINIFTDSGRILRPIFVLKSDKSNELIEGNYDRMKNWKSCIHGYIYTIDPNISTYSNRYYHEEFNELKSKHGDDLLDILEKYSAPIEYIDSTESIESFIAKDMYSIDKEYTHCEIHGSLLLSPLTLQIPFPDHNQYPRNVFSCQQTKQAVGIYSSAYNNRFDTMSHVLQYPQRPLITTRYNKYTNVESLPNGQNIIVAIASYSGYNQEDSIIINQSSVERGMFNSFYFRSYEENEKVEKNNTSHFANPNYVDTTLKDPDNYSKLDENGFIKEGEYVTDTDKITSLVQKTILPNGKEINRVTGSKISKHTSGIVDRVIVTKNRDNLRKCRVRIYKRKIPTIGDKYASRCGQKGMCGFLLKQVDMPFSKTGLVPDMIINPHAIPSRMTVNQLLEVLLGKCASIGGYFGDATPFQNTDEKDYSKLLLSYGYESKGNEILYSGTNGEQLKTSIFMGPTYYQRMKIMVADKMFSRGTGNNATITNQPMAGRSTGGGLRIGEMERDAILSHGTCGFLQESTMKRSDGYNHNRNNMYTVPVDDKTGHISHTSDKKVSIPYSAKLFIQEMEAMSISANIMTPQTIDNKELFETVNKVESETYGIYEGDKKSTATSSVKPPTKPKKEPESPKKEPLKEPEPPKKKPTRELEKGITRLRAQTALEMVERKRNDNQKFNEYETEEFMKLKPNSAELREYKLIQEGLDSKGSPLVSEQTVMPNPKSDSLEPEPE